MDTSSPAIPQVLLLTGLCITWTVLTSVPELIEVVRRHGESQQAQTSVELLTPLSMIRMLTIGPLLETALLLLMTFVGNALLRELLGLSWPMRAALLLGSAFAFGAVTHKDSYGLSAGIVFCILTLPILGGLESGDHRTGFLRSYLAHAAHNGFVLAVYTAALHGL